MVQWLKVLAAATLAAAVVACSGGKTATPSPVVLIGLDGFAWEMIAPLVHGERYPLVDWEEPTELLGRADWHRPRGNQGEAVAMGPSGNPLVDIGGLAHEVRLGKGTAQRYRIGATFVGRTPAIRVRLSVRFFFENDSPPQMSGNNETVWREIMVGPTPSSVALEIQPPTPARAFSVELSTQPADLASGEQSGAQPPGAAVMVQSIQMTRGRLAGLPEKGFRSRLLKSSVNLLPRLSRLMRRGSVARLANYEPALSPILWTSAVTGQGPERHGVDTFLTDAPGAKGKVPASSTMRREPALWNVLTSHGEKSSGVVSWWATWPAEELRGFMVSDRASDAALNILRDRGQLPLDPTPVDLYREYDTFPRELGAQIRPRFRDPESFEQSEIRQFIPGLTAAGWERFASIKGVSQDDQLSFLKFYYAKDLSTLEVGLPLFEEHRPDFWAIYFNGADALQHMVLHWNDPTIFPGVEPAGERPHGEIIERYYRFLDRIVGQIVDAAGPEATVVIASDHGVYPVDFMRSNPQGSSGGHRWRSPGVLIASGRGIRRGVVAEDAHIVDLAPTILRLLEYPIADDLEGRVLEELFEPRWLAKHPGRTMPGYGRIERSAVGETPRDAGLDAEIKERLRALGYLD